MKTYAEILYDRERRSNWDGLEREVEREHSEAPKYPAPTPYQYSPADDCFERGYRVRAAKDIPDQLLRIERGLPRPPWEPQTIPAGELWSVTSVGGASGIMELGRFRHDGERFVHWEWQVDVMALRGMLKEGSVRKEL